MSWVLDFLRKSVEGRPWCYSSQTKRNEVTELEGPDGTSVVRGPECPVCGHQPEVMVLGCLPSAVTIAQCLALQFDKCAWQGA